MTALRGSVLQNVCQTESIYALVVSGLPQNNNSICRDFIFINFNYMIFVETSVY